jgi:hypothetical protein
MYAHHPVHRLPGGQPQTVLERDARLAAAKTLTEHELWRDCLSGVADSGGQYSDDAGGSGWGDFVLDEGAR